MERDFVSPYMVQGLRMDSMQGQYLRGEASMNTKHIVLNHANNITTRICLLTEQ